MALTFYNSIDEFIGVLRQLTVAELDGNIYTLHIRLKTIEEESGKSIAFIESTGTALIIHYTDNTTEAPMPLPVAIMRYVGVWTNDTPYAYLNVVTVGPGSVASSEAAGIYMALISHFSPSLPTLFDPAATDDSGNLLWAPMMPLADVNNDIAFCRMGTIPPIDSSNFPGGRLIGHYVAIRPFEILAPLVAEGFLGTAPLTSVTLLLEKNESEIGEVLFSASQTATFTYPDTVQWDRGDRIGLRLLTSDGIAADLAITLAGRQLVT